MNDTASATYHDEKSSLSATDRWYRRLVFKLIGELRYGQITVKENGISYVFGDDDSLNVTLYVLSPSFYKKVLLGGSVGAGEAYIDKQWEADDLTALVRIMVLNMNLLDRMERGFAWLLQPLYIISHALNANSEKRAKKNIISHYDLGNELYSSFLDETMMYSSAIYPEQKSSLHEASLNKLDAICKKMKLNPDDRIIEIGAGWGGFAIHAAKNFGCHVTTTTISDAQFTEASKRINEAGLNHKITLLKKDYRKLSGKFDKLVSIEMIEAVGHNFLPIFFKKCCELLKGNGLMLLQAITIADQKYDQYVRSADFIQRHIFPGGCLPSNKRMISLITDRTDMVVRRLDDFGADYARTLKDWRIRFNESFPTLKKHGFDERFRRLWEFYLCYCEGGFLERSISVVHLIATRPGNRELI